MADRLRVLVVDHTAGVGPFRRRYDVLARDPSLEITVLAPETWIENSRVVRAEPASGTYRLRTGRAAWRGYENRGFFVSGLASAIAAARPDVLHLQEEPFSVIALQAALLCRLLRPRCRIVFYAFDNLYGGTRYAYRPSWAYAAFQRVVQRLADAGVAACGDAGTILRSRGFAKPIRYIPLGIDPELYRAGDSTDVRRRLDLRGFVVGYAGRFLPFKGLEFLGRAMPSLPGEWTLLAVGSGPERATLERVAAEAGWSDRLRIPGGVAHGDVPALLDAMDVLVLPSVSTEHFREQFGRVLVEAMACGVPLVGSDSGSIPETMGDAGIVVPERDAGALGAALRRLAEDPAERARLGEAGRRRALRHFTWERIAEGYGALWHGVARGELESEPGPSWRVPS